MIEKKKERVPELKAESRDKFIDPGTGIRLYDADGNLLEIVGDDPEVTRERKRRLGRDD